MKEENQTVILSNLRKAFDTHPQVWRDYKKLGETVIDCAELIQEKSSHLRLSKGFMGSSLDIEEILRREEWPELLHDFQSLIKFLDRIRQLQIEASSELGDLVLITSEFLLAMEEIEDSEE